MPAKAVKKADPATKDAKAASSGKVSGSKKAHAKRQAKAQVAKALKLAKANKLGVKSQATKKVRSSVHFRRPKTLSLKRAPKYPRKSAPSKNKLDQFRVLRYPLSTESAMKKIEEDNTLVFVVDVKANKYHIADAVKRMYDIKARRINTLIRPDGQKKAYVMLSGDSDALDVANKIGII